MKQAHTSAFGAFWREFRRDSLGMVGLFMLVAFLVLAVIGPMIIPYQEAATRWQDITYWQDNPDSAPPEWVNLFSEKKLSSTWHSPAVVPKVTAGDGASFGSARFDYEFKADSAPLDVILHMEGSGLVAYKAYMVRPDGKEVLFLQDNIELSQGVNGRMSAMSGSRELAMEWVREGLSEEESYNLDPDLFVPLPYLFSASGEANTDDLVALKGTYTLRLDFAALGDAKVEKAHVVVPGAVSGWLGTDKSKRDLFSGLVIGIQWALVIGILTSLLNVLVGVTLAIISGYLGGAVDAILQRVTEFFLQLPVLPFIIVISAIFRPSIWILIGIFCLFFWVGPVKPVRSMTLQIREETFVEASKALGAGRFRIILRHIFPILLPFSFASIALSVPGIIVYEASLSLLGLGDATIVTWGQILNGAFQSQAFLSNMWWWVVPPGLAMALMGMTFAFLGFSLDKILHPKLKTR